MFERPLTEGQLPVKERVAVFIVDVARNLDPRNFQTNNVATVQTRDSYSDLTSRGLSSGEAYEAIAEE